ncbi:MAG: hypothetical protein PHQ23_00490 [Candidatus Wallbacteria bacterium]|nr:hypothetical protein [Candidatus Wallbacteria bacterium]
MIVALGLLLVMTAIVIVVVVFNRKEPDVVLQGVDYYNQKKYESQLDDCLKVISEDPNYTIAYYNAACCYAQLSQSGKALEMLEQALILDRNEGRAYGMRESAEKDPELDPVKGNPAYVLMMERYR